MAQNFLLLFANIQLSFGTLGGAAIAQWFSLCLPSCRPRFKPQACHLHFIPKSNLYFICHVKRTEINKETGFDTFYKRTYFFTSH